MADSGDDWISKLSEQKQRDRADEKLSDELEVRRGRTLSASIPILFSSIKQGVTAAIQEFYRQGRMDFAKEISREEHNDSLKLSKSDFPTSSLLIVLNADTATVTCTYSTKAAHGKKYHQTKHTYYIQLGDANQVYLATDDVEHVEEPVRTITEPFLRAL